MKKSKNRKQISRKGKDYSGTELERKKTQIFLEFLLGNAEKGTYDKGYKEKGKKSILPCEDLVILTLVRKLRATQKQPSLSPRGVGGGLGHGKN